MNISCEDCPGDNQRGSIDCVVDDDRKAIDALFAREQRVDSGDYVGD
jgi:tetrahydromethanopterin S-methyltransferase subunit F